MKHIKKFENTQSKLDNLKQQLINEIVEDTQMTSLEKLKSLKDNNLFGYSEFVQDEFIEWENEALELEKKTASEKRETYTSGIANVVWSLFDYDKYQTISYYDVLKEIFEKSESLTKRFHGTEYNKENPIIPIIYTRGPHIAIWKPFNEICDKVLEYAIENKIIGFTNDW